MKLADLKRIAVGTELILTHCLLGPRNNKRKVHEVTATGIWFTGPDLGKGKYSWLGFPKAKEFRDDGDGFSIVEIYEDKEILAVQYKFVKA
jgi:hypothetical protein